MNVKCFSHDFNNNITDVYVLLYISIAMSILCVCVFVRIQTYKLTKWFCMCYYFIN